MDRHLSSDGFGAALATGSVNQPVISVAQLNRRVAQLLEGSFRQIWVRGEVSNFTAAASGHWYFTIKDERASVRAVMFRSRCAVLGFVPRVGERFDFKATVCLYEPRGDYQLQVDGMRRAGQGDLHEAFLLLKQKLAAEGLFDTERKRIPRSVPNAIGVLTSPNAAALRDVLTTLARRAPHVPVILYPAPVQGHDAAERLRLALEQACRRAEVDTLLLVRGGGSLEDLWSFNDEALARAIAASPIPIISGVGHETDFTIADFVADVRAPTPTAAAELVCHALDACAARIDGAMAALTTRQLRLLQHAGLRLDRGVAMLVSPAQRLRQARERLDNLRARLARAAGVPLERRAARLDWARTRLISVAEGLVVPKRARLVGVRQTLAALNPRNILGRGYAIVRDDQGRIIRQAEGLAPGDRLGIELGEGRVDASVL